MTTVQVPDEGMLTKYGGLCHKAVKSTFSITENGAMRSLKITSLTVGDMCVQGPPTGFFGLESQQC